MLCYGQHVSLCYSYGVVDVLGHNDLLRPSRREPCVHGLCLKHYVQHTIRNTVFNTEIPCSLLRAAAHEKLCDDCATRERKSVLRVTI